MDGPIQPVPLQRREILVAAPGEVRLQEAPTDGLGETVIANLCSVVSAGTERSLLAGREAWAPLPTVPGYGSVGVVLRGGAEWGVAPGERVITWGAHASHIAPRTLVARLPDSLDAREAVLARMAVVAISALRAATVELGDAVAVQGAGLVGQLAAQLLQLQGATVALLDVDPGRLAIARRCGVERVVDARGAELPERLRAVLGEAPGLVVEATGVPDLVATAVSCCGPRGEVVLLGTPRGPFTGDAAALLREVHMGRGVTLRSGFEWFAPERPVPHGPKHSLQRNLRIVLDLIAAGRLQVAPLITDVVAPADCAAVYARVASGDPGLLGVLFDWGL